MLGPAVGFFSFSRGYGMVFDHFFLTRIFQDLKTLKNRFCFFRGYRDHIKMLTRLKLKKNEDEYWISPLPLAKILKKNFKTPSLGFLVRDGGCRSWSNCQQSSPYGFFDLFYSKWQKEYRFHPYLIAGGLFHHQTLTITWVKLIYLTWICEWCDVNISPLHYSSTLLWS